MKLKTLKPLVEIWSPMLTLQVSQYLRSYAVAFAVAQSASSLTTVGNNEQCRSHCAVPNDVTIANLP